MQSWMVFDSKIGGRCDMKLEMPSLPFHLSHPPDDLAPEKSVSAKWPPSGCEASSAVTLVHGNLWKLRM